MSGHKRKTPSDALSGSHPGKGPGMQAKRRASNAKVPFEAQQPAKAATGPNPIRQGRDSPIAPMTTADDAQVRSNGAQLDNLGGSQSPAQFSKNQSRKFDKDDKQQDNKDVHSDSYNLRSRTRSDKLKHSSTRSTSYKDPLPHLAESSKVDVDSSHSGRSGQAPLTEANLRHLLRSIDREKEGSGSGRRSEPQLLVQPVSIPVTQPVSVSEPLSLPPLSAPHSKSTAAANLNSTGAKFNNRSSPMRKSKSPKKQDKDRDKKKSAKHDTDTHPLNLPPDQLRKLTARMAREEAERQSMSMDRDIPETTNKDSTPNDSSQPATPSQDAPGAFPDEPATNGVNGHNEQSPTPPPHKAAPAPKEKVDPEACKAAGNKFFKAKDYDKAIAEYSKAVEADPTNPTYLSNRAAAYISANKYSQALGDSLQASRLDPNNDKILHRLARIYTSLGRPQDALDTYAKLPNASATDTAAARKALQSIELAEKQINSEDGNGNMALWSIEQAKQTLGRETPTPRSWQILKAKANLKVGTANALGEVQAISQSLMRENGMDAEAIVLAARAMYLRDEKTGGGKSDYERAEDYFRQALSLDPDNTDARNNLRTMKRLDRARTSANDMFKRGKYHDAVEAYSEALTIDPSNKVTNAKLLGNRATARIRIKEFDEAKADCDQALKLDPTYTKARRLRAKATGESGDWEQAVKDYKALLEDNPQDPELNKELRNAELELKKSKRKDYYKILGVEKDAGDKEIERAYKRKAAVLHPDKTMGDKKKEEEFKDCLEAKETLLDPQKRQMYDSGADLMEPGMGMGGGFPGGMGGFGGMGGMGGGGVQIDPEMLFNMMNGGGGGGGGFRFNTGGGPGGFSAFG
ncbi:hypothetical protein LTR99_007768 [Exophiala xenobiotica]|uniref:J domain-containing protein n=1 Tax=Vermiconidia calcicola TaxID=1690605 RepID=A0AAV9Q3W9_9PEZI|nr:hypothetical protein H2202_005971 [Exophiala xenobiotica]KAK5535261.1 hypothetical protein LTR25_006269 [Vermiconidia calcicola]KAK5546762.1 hypothetical protein LTR23_003133 [Chaetothyriales sp. CCFEE 6169]KAK5223744.1 hypothetical protein LTR72_005130 [Exophiala xenobiotica]KAK5289145.1 hypothetical protein LTR14_007396 [Exophiala xenobiotica]